MWVYKMVVEEGFVEIIVGWGIFVFEGECVEFVVEEFLVLVY